MENYKIKLYEKYYSTHNANLYGDITLDKIRINYPIWDYFFKDHFPENSNARILDIGCGDGGFVHYLHEMGYLHAEGIDYSQEQIDHGSKIGITNLRKNDVFEYLSKNQEGYNMIIARDVLEHFTKQEIFDLMSLINNALLPAGVLMIQVPNGEGIHASSIVYGDFTHETAFTESSIHQLFLNTGFTSVTCFATGPVPKNLKGMLRIVVWSIRVCIAKFWRWIETGKGGRIFTTNLLAVGKK